MSITKIIHFVKLKNADIDSAFQFPVKSHDRMSRVATYKRTSSVFLRPHPLSWIKIEYDGNGIQLKDGLFGLNVVLKNMKNDVTLRKGFTPWVGDVKEFVSFTKQ
jgi:hypothetical protein